MKANVEMGRLGWWYIHFPEVGGFLGRYLRKDGTIGIGTAYTEKLPKDNGKYKTARQAIAHLKSHFSSNEVVLLRRVKDAGYQFDIKGASESAVADTR